MDNALHEPKKIKKTQSGNEKNLKNWKKPIFIRLNWSRLFSTLHLLVSYSALLLVVL